MIASRRFPALTAHERIHHGSRFAPVTRILTRHSPASTKYVADRAYGLPASWIPCLA